MFKINLNAPRQKKKLKQEPIEYLEPQPEDSCLTCKHERKLDMTYGEVYCSKCFAVYDNWWITEDDKKNKNSNAIIWNRNYDKSRWTNYSLDLMLGVNNHEITDRTWLELLEEIPDPCTWYEVYKIFQKYDLLKYYVAFGSFVGLKPKFNSTIMEHFEAHVDMTINQYRVSYFYLLYKFTQLFGEEGSEQYIPLKNSKAWCKKTDNWWELMCIENGWHFFPTKIHKIHWNKKYHLEKFTSCMKEYTKATLSWINVDCSGSTFRKEELDERKFPEEM